MLRNDIPGLDSFLRDHPGMSLAPLLESDVIVKGRFAFSASSLGTPVITDAYRPEIKSHLRFPEHSQVLLKQFLESRATGIIMLTMMAHCVWAHR